MLASIRRWFRPTPQPEPDYKAIVAVQYAPFFAAMDQLADAAGRGDLTNFDVKCNDAMALLHKAQQPYEGFSGRRSA